MKDYRGKHVSSAPWNTSSPSYRGRHRIRNRRHRKWIILVLVLVGFMLAWPLIEARLLGTERVQLKADQLPAEANNLRIVYLSDIHYGFWFSDGDLNRLVSRINSLRPDLVLFGGDYATDHQTAVEFFKKLKSGEKIRSRYGTFGVIGETDRGESDFDLNELTETMANADVEPLVNRTVPVHIGAAKIYIAGIDDVNTGKPDLKTVSRSVSASDYVILLSHSPSIIPDAQLAKDSSGNLGWFDLGLFGHTHGGQMLFFSSFLNLAEDVPDRYRSGWLKENRVDLLVSRGVGTSVFPGRLFCFPQIHYIEVSY
jgi:hypothetical protein